MKVITKLHSVLPVQMGETDRGTWYRGGMVCESLDGEQRTMAFVVQGKKNTELLQQIPYGSTIEVEFVIESRNFNDKWYTDLRVTNIETLTSTKQ